MTIIDADTGEIVEETALAEDDGRRLALLESGQRALSEATDVRDILDIANRAQSLRGYFARYSRESDVALDAQQTAAKLYTDSRRKAGKVLTAMKEDGERHDGRGSGSNQYELKSQDVTPATLDDLGVDKKTASRLQLEAELPDDVYEEVIEAAREDGKEITSSLVRNEAKKRRREVERRAAADKAHDDYPSDIVLYEDDALQIVPTLADNSISLVIADPPYNVTKHTWDRVGGDAEYLDFTRGWLAAIRPKLRDAYHLYLFCSPSYAAQIEMMLHDEGWPLKSRIIWSHRNLSMGRGASDKYITMWEMCFHIGTHALNLPTVWNDERFEVKEFAAPQSNFNEGKHHPTAKPVELIKQFVRHGSQPGDVVLDPFAGGGTTGAACVDVGARQCVLIERAPEYCAVIKQRLGMGDGN